MPLIANQSMTFDCNSVFVKISSNDMYTSSELIQITFTDIVTSENVARLTFTCFNGLVKSQNAEAPDFYSVLELC